MILHLVAPGQPVSAKNHMRPLRLGNGRTIIARGKVAERWFAATVPVLAKQFAAHGLPTLRAPLRVETHQFLKHAPGAGPSPDGDNVQAAVWDALVKARVIDDDKWIVTWGGSRRQDARNPRVEIEITYAGADQ